MDNIFQISIDGITHNAMAISTFNLENKDYCIYAVPDGNGIFGIYTGILDGNTIIEIDNQEEKNMVNNFVKSLIIGMKRKEVYDMNNDDEIFYINDNGINRRASLVGEYEIDNQDYVVYAVEEDEDRDGLYVKKIIEDNDEIIDLVDIEDEEERKNVFTILIEAINEEMGAV